MNALTEFHGHPSAPRAGAMAASRDRIVFIPGLFETPDIWQAVETGFLNRRSLHLDLPGHVPGSDAAEVRAALGSGAWLDRLEQRIDEHRQGQKVHLVGHSSGGLAAMLLADRRPETVRSIVIVAGLMAGHRDAGPDLPSALIRQDLLGRWLCRLAWQRGTTSRARFSQSLGTVIARSALDRVPDRMRQQLRQCEPEAVRLFAKWVLEQDATAIARRVQAPALVIIARDDTVVPPRHQIRLLRTLPNARAQVLPGGHLCFVEHPVLFGRTIRSWLALNDTAVSAPPEDGPE